MDKRLLATGVSLAWVTLLFASPARTESNSPLDTAQLESLIAKHDATVRNIELSPLFAEYTWRTETTLAAMPSPDGSDLSGPVVFEGRTRYWRDGKNFREDREQKNTWARSGEVRDLSSIFLIADRYAVEYRKNNPVLSLYHFADRDKLPPNVASQVEMLPNPDLIDFGVRYRKDQSLMETYEQRARAGQPRYHWKAFEIDVEGAPYLQIVIERGDGDNRRLHQELLLDPRSGYLISDRRTYNKNGEAFYIVQATFQLVADGIWLPKAVSHNVDKGGRLSTMQIEKISLGDPEIGTKISLEALDVDRESITMIEHPGNGALKTLKGYLDGKWVPIESLPPERMKIIERARRKAYAESK